jgi:hypothetical protein
VVVVVDVDVDGSSVELVVVVEDVVVEVSSPLDT